MRRFLSFTIAFMFMLMGSLALGQSVSQTTKVKIGGLFGGKIKQHSVYKTAPVFLAPQTCQSTTCQTTTYSTIPSPPTIFSTPQIMPAMAPVPKVSVQEVKPLIYSPSHIPRQF